MNHLKLMNDKCFISMSYKVDRCICSPGFRIDPLSLSEKIDYTMKALIIETYNPNLIRAMRSMKVVEMEKPVPDSGEVLVKIQAAPINPSDIAFIRGGYNIKKSLPAIPGFEGTGMIESVGSEVDEQLIGKRVSFFSQDDKGGTCAEYAAVKLKDCLFVNKDLPLKQAACLFVNPLTAYAMFDHLVENQQNFNEVSLYQYVNYRFRRLA